MSSEELQRKTSINIQEKANLIWSIADKLVGVGREWHCTDTCVFLQVMWWMEFKKVR